LGLLTVGCDLWFASFQGEIVVTPGKCERRKLSDSAYSATVGSFVG
jgi:hypothetical protein